MNAVNQYLEISQKWVDGQISIGQGWINAMQNLERFDLGLIWDRTIEAQHASVQSVLDAKVAGTEIWFEEVLPVNKLPQTAVDAVHELRAVTNEVTEAQRTVVNGYFSMLRKIDLNELPLVGKEDEPFSVPDPRPAKEIA